MTERVRWYKLEAPSQPSPRAFASLLNERRFSADGTSGFVLDELRTTHLTGRFVQRTELVERFVDPLGNVISNERVVINEVKFRYQARLPQLELTDSPRGIAAFVAELMQLFAAEVVIAPIELDVRRCLKALEKAVGKVTVARMEIRGILIAGDVAAKVSFESGREVRKVAADFLQARDLPIARARASWVGEENKVQCEFTSRGVRFLREQGDLVRQAVRAVLGASGA